MTTLRRYRANSGRLGSQLVRRAMRGHVIDRARVRNPKDPPSIPVPPGLAKFFRPIGQGKGES